MHIMPDHLDMQHMLAQLRQRYIAELPQEFITLQELAEKMVSDEEVQSTLNTLHQKLHKLTGSGGTFGFTELSDHARILEQKAKKWLDCPTDAILLRAREIFALEVAQLKNSLSGTEVSLESELSSNTAKVDLISIAKVKEDSISIWLVDNDEDSSQVLIQQLYSFNYLVRYFQQIKDAELAATETKPDVLLLGIDFNEGVNSSADLFGLKKLSELNCPLIIISTTEKFSARVQASRLNAVGYFIKPINNMGLINCISQTVNTLRALPPRILIVDDDVQLAEHYRLSLLAAGMEVKILGQLDLIMEVIAEFRPELILMDMYMPDFTGPELAGVIRQHENWSSLPIVYLSAETDTQQKMSAMSRGADDFLLKPISSTQLVSAIRVRVERARQLESMISCDSLTRLLKHANFKESAEIEVARARRSKRSLCLVMLDIDHFKSVNDHHGHAAGDMVISALATLLRQRLRRTDVIGRYGGEEFAALLPECSSIDAFSLVDKLRSSFSLIEFKHRGEVFRCTLSAGVSSLEYFPDSQASALLAAADEALYSAKSNGRNQVREAKK
jgi:diguanylate cyclase (GGDEF)-like protein